ncbi:MAG: hypothetical protein KC766_20745 [Myxococcales bacterium]|nr:hypothetical protein [Myxococcales bacterium]
MAETKKKPKTTNRKERRAAERKAKIAERADKKRGHGGRVHERRFDAPGLSTTPVALIGGALGALALGAGVHGQWIRDEPLKFAPYLVAGGAAALMAALVFGDAAAYPVRVGDAGVAVERRGEISRILWCDVESIFLQGNDLVISSSDLVLRIPVKLHQSAVAWIVKEATERRPDQLKLTSDEEKQLPSLPTATYERLPVEGLQLTGRKCASSDKTISLEEDARLCPNCGQVYHAHHVPSQCVTCEAKVGSRGMRLG